jgi:hypothetical protein
MNLRTQAILAIAALGSRHPQYRNYAKGTPLFGFDFKQPPSQSRFAGDARGVDERRDDRKAARKRVMRLRLRRGR